MIPRRTIRQYAAQTVQLDCSQQETFIIDFNTSISNLSITNISPGQLYVFVLRQDVKGSHKLAWGNLARNGMMLDPQPKSVTVQCFVGMTGGFLQAVTPGTWSEESPP